MQKSESIGGLATALAKAQGQIVNPVLDKQADIKSEKRSYSYRYVSLGAVLDSIRPVFTAHGLSFLQLPSNGKTGPAVSLLLLHSSGEWVLTDPLEIPSQKQDAQSYGSALTYGRRYVLTAIAGVVGEDDDDAQAAMRPPRKREEPPRDTVYQRILRCEMALIAKGLCREGELRHWLDERIGGAVVEAMPDWPDEMATTVKAAISEFAAAQKAQRPRAA